MIYAIFEGGGLSHNDRVEFLQVLDQVDQVVLQVNQLLVELRGLFVGKFKNGQFLIGLLLSDLA